MSALATLCTDLLGQIITLIDDPFTMTSLSQANRHIKSTVVKTLTPCPEVHAYHSQAKKAYEVLVQYAKERDHYPARNRASARRYSIETLLDIGDHHIYYRIVFTNYFNHAQCPTQMYSVCGLAILQWSFKYVLLPESIWFNNSLWFDLSTNKRIEKPPLAAPLKHLLRPWCSSYFNNDMRRAATWMLKEKRPTPSKEEALLKSVIQQTLQQMDEDYERLEAQALITAAKCDFGVLDVIDESDDDDFDETHLMTDEEEEACVKYSDASDEEDMSTT
jgi:hypothetical protein